MASDLHRRKSQIGNSGIGDAVFTTTRSARKGSRSGGRRRSGREAATAAAREEDDDDDDENDGDDGDASEGCCEHSGNGSVSEAEGGHCSSAEPEDHPGRFCLEDLPTELLNRVFGLLPLQSVLLLGQTCGRLADVTQEEDGVLWRHLCLQDFARYTDIELWLQPDQPQATPPGLSPSSSSSSLSRRKSGILSDEANLPPEEATGYRSLYRILSHFSRLIGTWRALGEGPRGPLYHFRWRPDCVEGIQVLCSQDSDEVSLSPFLSFSGRPSGGVTLVFADDDRCTLEEPPACDLGGSFSGACSKAQAAAAVAGSSGGVVGGSPEGTFGHEFMLFMQGTVGRNAQGSRRKKKSPGRSLREAAPIVHHLARVDVVPPTNTHRLSGLWQGALGEEGAQVVNVHYCFRKNSARIVATKVTGDEHIGSGMLLWEAEASPMREPWSHREVEYILRAENLGENGGDLAEEQLLAVRDVADVHMGHAPREQFGGGKKGAEGRLWRYESGSIGFFWILKNNEWHFAEFTRLDDLLQSELGT